MVGVQNWFEAPSGQDSNKRAISIPLGHPHGLMEHMCDLITPLCQSKRQKPDWRLKQGKNSSISILFPDNFSGLILPDDWQRGILMNHLINKSSYEAGCWYPNVSQYLTLDICRMRDIWASLIFDNVDFCELALWTIRLDWVGELLCWSHREWFLFWRQRRWYTTCRCSRRQLLCRRRALFPLLFRVFLLQPATERFLARDPITNYVMFCFICDANGLQLFSNLFLLFFLFDPRFVRFFCNLSPFV